MSDTDVMEKGWLSAWFGRHTRPKWGCNRCHSKGAWHTTYYPEDEPGEHGALPLCERCWDKLTVDQRVRWYRRLWNIWNTGGFWIQYHDGTWHEWTSRPVSWPVLEEAVRADSTSTETEPT